MKRGDMYWANIWPRSGSEQSGKRPVIIISNDGFNSHENWRSIIVVPLTTSSKQALRGPTSIIIPKGTAELKKDGVVLCHQITTIDRSKLTEFIGHIPRTQMIKIEEGIKVAVDLF